MKEFASRLGARIGNANDRRWGPELGRHPRPALWKRIDKIAGWLYVRPDK